MLKSLSVYGGYSSHKTLDFDSWDHILTGEGSSQSKGRGRSLGLQCTASIHHPNSSLLLNPCPLQGDFWLKR